MHLVIDGEEITYTYVDELDEKTITRSHTDDRGRVGTVTYPNYELRIVQEEDYFTLCENINLGIEQWIKNEFIQDDKCSNDLSTTLLSVEKGETVSIVDERQAGYTLVKLRTGEVGWIPKDCYV